MTEYHVAERKVFGAPPSAVRAAFGAGGGTIDRARDLVRFGTAAAVAWTRGGGRLMRIRIEATRLLREREWKLHHGEDVSALEARLEQLHRDAYRALEATHERVDDERFAVAETQIIRPE